jgi:DNA-directed RNA polymerase
MKVKMGYTKRESKPIKSLFSKLRLGSISRPLIELDVISNQIAFMPNFIHSMDATNIQLLIKRLIYKGFIMNLLTNHDCFATTPNYMYYLNKEIRLAFFMIYFEDDYIKNVHEHFIKQIYNTTELIYIKETDKLVEINIKDIKNQTLSLDLNQEYVIIIKNKEYTIPRLPYNTKN